jgi:predicted dehydrogenase
MADVRLVGLADLHRSSAERRKAEYQLDDAQTGDDVPSMLKELGPDVVFDCTVPEARLGVVEAALVHGCHVLSEKPMATSLEAARSLVATAQKAGKIFAVMQNRRYDGRIRALRDFLRADEIGEVTTVNGDFYLGPHFGGFREQMQHVLLLDMAIHSFDQARVLCGGDPVAVYCREWNPNGSWYGHGASAVAIFEMSGGAVYTYRGSWCAEGLNTSWECDWRISGTRGSILWDGGDGVRAQVVAGDQGFLRPMRDLVPHLPTGTQPSGHAACIADFIRCLREGRPPETICTDNIKSLAMVLGAIESAETGRRITLSS